MFLSPWRECHGGELEMPRFSFTRPPDNTGCFQVVRVKVYSLPLRLALMPTRSKRISCPSAMSQGAPPTAMKPSRVTPQWMMPSLS
jgi:hypothetical protein